MLATTEANGPKLDAGPWRSERSKAEAQMKVLVVDDHFLIREALRGCIKKLKSTATILEATSAHQAMELVSKNPDINLVVLELNLPDRDGFSVLAELRQRHPTVSIVVLSARQDPDSVARALDLGALGFIPKSELREVTLSALNLVLAGGVYIPPEILLREPPSPGSPKLARIASSAKAVKPADLGLTDRQAEVLGLIMKGKSNKAISRTLNLALPTVKNHVTALFKAIEVTNRTEAVVAIGNLGLSWPQIQTVACLSETGSAKS